MSETRPLAGPAAADDDAGFNDAGLIASSQLFDELALAARGGVPAQARAGSDPAAELLTAFSATLSAPPALDLQRILRGAAARELELAPTPVPAASPAHGHSWRRRAGAVLAAVSLTIPLGSAAFAASPGTPLYPVRVAVFGLAPSDHEGRAREALARAEELLHQRETASLDAATTELERARQQLRSMEEGEDRAAHESHLGRLERLQERLSAPATPAVPTPSAPVSTPATPSAPGKAKPTKPAQPQTPARTQKPAQPQKPTTAKKPAQPQKPTTAKQPAQTQKPAKAKKPSSTKKPTGTKSTSAKKKERGGR